MNYDRNLLDAILRRDLVAFTRKAFHVVSPGAYHDNWHIQAIAWQLQEVAAGRVKRLLVTMPPRHLKSICASVAFPAWILGQDPTRRIICASYSTDLATKHARDCRAVMEGDWYRRVFPLTRLDPDKNAELEFMTTRRGFRYATSVGGTLTGRGGNLIIIDDPMKAQEAMSETKRQAVRDWYSNTLYSRLDNKVDDAMVLIMQRLHVDDLAGHVLDTGGWVHLNIPAIAEGAQRYQIGDGQFHDRQFGEVIDPRRESAAVLTDLKRTLGTYDFSAQYQQTPAPPGGAMIKLNWFSRFRHPPGFRDGHMIVQSWDTAAKATELSDYSVCTTWYKAEDDFYLLNVFRERLDFPMLKRKVVEQYNRVAGMRMPVKVLIEDKSSGTQLIQELRREKLVRPTAFTPEGDKIMRMHAQSSKIEAGQIHLPFEAPWLQDFETEMMQFPNGKFDDQVDSVSQFLSWVDWRRRNTIRYGTVVGP